MLYGEVRKVQPAARRYAASVSYLERNDRFIADG